MSLKGKRALITGGTAGIGRAIAHCFAAEGAICAVNFASNESRAKEALDALPGQGHILVQGSTFEKDSVQTVIKTTIERLGGLDILVCNSGWTRASPWTDINSFVDLSGYSAPFKGFLSCTTEDYENAYQRNVLSHLWATQAAEAELKQNNGSVIIIASMAGKFAAGSSMAYAVSKSAAIHLGTCLAKSLAPKVRVNSIAPGFVDTEWISFMTKEQRDFAIGISALGHFARPEDIAGAALMLVSNQSITGQCIEVAAGLKL